MRCLKSSTVARRRNAALSASFAGFGRRADSSACHCVVVRAILQAGAQSPQAIGRSRGGLSTKVHALLDAQGNPVDFFLTGGEAHDLVGADHRRPTMEADTLIGDKAFDADARGLEPLANAGRTGDPAASQPVLAARL